MEEEEGVDLGMSLFAALDRTELQLVLMIKFNDHDLITVVDNPAEIHDETVLSWESNRMVWIGSASAIFNSFEFHYNPEFPST